MAIATILQTPQVRHVADYVHRLPAEMNALGLPAPLCGIHLDRLEVRRTKVELIPAAACCPDCIAVARRWYGAWLFEPFDAVQRRRLLANLARDLERAS